MKTANKKKSFTRAKYLTIGVAALLAILVFGAYWRSHNSEQTQVKNTLNSEIKPFKTTLSAMGFDTSKIKTYCDKPGPDRYCSASLSSYVVIQRNPDDLNRYAGQLSEKLSQNAWHQRADYPTIAWFEKIGRQVDYQPDQLNTKQIGVTSCSLDFFTSFSKPTPAAITLDASCSKGTPTQKIQLD